MPSRGMAWDNKNGFRGGDTPYMGEGVKWLLCFAFFLFFSFLLLFVFIICLGLIPLTEQEFSVSVLVFGFALLFVPPLFSSSILLYDWATGIYWPRSYFVLLFLPFLSSTKFLVAVNSPLYSYKNCYTSYCFFQMYRFSKLQHDAVCYGESSLLFYPHCRTMSKTPS